MNLFEAGVGGLLLGGLIAVAIIRSQLQKQANQLVKERKDQFVALASHYLLTPTTVIQAALTTLQDKDAVLDGAGRHKLYDALERGYRRMLIVAEQLLLVGNISDNTLTLQLGVNNLFNTVTEAASVVDPFARAKNIAITVQDDSRAINECRFDARRMKQALVALLDNAIKFSLEETAIEIVVSVENNIFQISIVDQGIGMSTKVLEHLSEKFYRGTDLYTFDYEGLGLGLHIAQAIIRLHHGNISFSSRPKQGTQALIEFPNL